jgi:hypothetical protein
MGENSFLLRWSAESVKMFVVCDVLGLEVGKTSHTSEYRRFHGSCSSQSRPIIDLGSHTEAGT